MRETLKKNVLRYRKRKGMGRRELADAAGLNEHNIKNVENNGWCQPETMQKIADALDVKPYVLIKE